MKITDKEYNIKHINKAYKGETTVEYLSVASREDDGLIYLLSGGAEYNCFNKKFSVKAGDVFYLSHNSSYDITITQFPYNYICINFLFDHNEAKPLDCEVYSSKRIESLEATFLNALKRWQSFGISERIMCRSHLLKIYSVLAENELRAYIPDSKLQKMQNIIFEIEKNYSDSQLSITDLSEMYGCSEAHFRRIFNQIYRISPQKYLSQIRLGKAKELLSDTALSINKIAESCGFSSAYYFDRVFKAENGITPVQYRKRPKK